MTPLLTDPVPLVACSRPEGEVARLLREQGVAVVPLPLEVGWRPLPDRYLLGESRLAERLTTARFARAIVTKTLFLTAIDLRAQVADRVFLIEGEMSPSPYSRLHPNAVRGALSALIAEYGASVLRTTDPEDSAALIALMARHAQLGVPEISVAAKRKCDSPADEQRRVVEMLPGVGFALARRLLQRLGSVERILGASPEEVAEVRGVSQGLAEGIGELGRREYCAVDFEEDLEEALARRPELVFDAPVKLVGRQHPLRQPEGPRLVADLVFVCDSRRTVYIVELKRGAARPEDIQQLSGYLNLAGSCRVLGRYLKRGYDLRGVLVAPASQVRGRHDPRVTVCPIDTEAAAQELASRRRERRDRGVRSG